MTKGSADGVGGHTRRGFGSEQIGAEGRECAGHRLLLTANMMEMVKYAPSTCCRHLRCLDTSELKRKRKKKEKEKKN